MFACDTHTNIHACSSSFIYFLYLRGYRCLPPASHDLRVCFCMVTLPSYTQGVTLPCRRSTVMMSTPSCIWCQHQAAFDVTCRLTRATTFISPRRVVVFYVVSNTNVCESQTKFIYEPLRDFTLNPETQTHNVGFVKHRALDDSASKSTRVEKRARASFLTTGVFFCVRVTCAMFRGIHLWDCCVGQSVRFYIIKFSKS